MVEKENEQPISIQDILAAGRSRSTEHLAFPSITQMAKKVVANAQEQHTDLNEIETGNLEDLALGCINEIEKLHNAPDILKNPPEDIDVVWIISAPGLLTRWGSKPGWSSQFPWLNECERKVVGKGLNLVFSVTARRLNKPVEEITKEDVLANGPWVVYNAPDLENADVEKILEDPDIKIPRKKVYIFSDFKDDSGQILMIKNTADQVRSIHMPQGVHPRKIAICVLAAQWVRLGRLLAKPQTLPKDTKVIVVPIQSPVGHEAEHAIMESTGAVVNAFKNGNATTEPISYSIT